MSSSRSYKIHHFAELAGVTVKALRHYDRLGLLSPQRTHAGYRAYSDFDLERLEQIVALKYLGLPLKEIKALLDHAVLALPDALRAQRVVLEEKQKALERAIQAIRTAEASLKPGEPANPTVLRTIIEVITMQEGVEAMKKYYSEAGWERGRRYYEEGPSSSGSLYGDANALLSADPASTEAQGLADRWLDLSLRAYRGESNVQTISPAAWADRANWPAAMKQRLSEFHLEEVTDFIQNVALHARRKYFTGPAWERFMELRKKGAADTDAMSRAWQAQVDLFRDVTTSMHEDPYGETGRDIAARWNSLLETEGGGDREIIASLRSVWSDRAHWTATLRWRMEGLSRLSGESFERAADFIERAAGTMVEVSRPVKR